MGKHRVPTRPEFLNFLWLELTQRKFKKTKKQFQIVQKNNNILKSGKMQLIKGLSVSHTLTYT